MQRAGRSDLDASFMALSDPTRRDMIRALLHKPRRAGELARYVAMSPQALSRHLRVLRKAGLITEQGLEEDARVRVYSVRPVALEPVQEWLWALEDIWRRQLQSFKSFAENAHWAEGTHRTEGAHRGRRTRP
jgi:DNA-binding transcriptional ArsR family regulator